jgi:anti-sigma B factor antagonist
LGSNRWSGGQDKRWDCAVPPSDDLITASLAQPDGIVVLSVSGQIDVTSESIFETAVESALADEPAGLVIDLSAVDFLGSAGLRTLAMTQEKLGSLAVVANRNTTVKPIQLTGLDQILLVHPTAEEALAALRNRLKPTVIEPSAVKPDDGDGAASGLPSLAPTQ